MSETASETIPRLGALPAAADQAQAGRDRPLTSAAAVELARGALAEVVAADCVGDHVAAACEAERLVTHLFDCSLPGYRGWRWAVTLSRLPRSRTATVCEMELLPGEDALLAPAWVPWADRLRPEDLTRAEGAARHGRGRSSETGRRAGTGQADGSSALRVAPRPPRVRAATGLARVVSRWYDGYRARREATAGAAGVVCPSHGLSAPMTGALRAVLGGTAGQWAAGGSQEQAGGLPDRDEAAHPQADDLAQPVDGAAAPGGDGEPAAGDAGPGAGSHGSHHQETQRPQDRAASARAAVIDLEAQLSARAASSTSAGTSPHRSPGDAGSPDGQEGPGAPGGPGSAGGGDAGGAHEPAGPEGPAGQDSPEGADEAAGAPRTLEELEAVLPRH